MNIISAEIPFSLSKFNDTFNDLHDMEFGGARYESDLILEASRKSVGAKLVALG